MTRCAAALALAALVACGGRTPPPAAAPAASRYVGGDTCRPCHAETWSTFARTGMGRSWYPLAGAALIEDWTRRNTVTVPESGLRYTMSRRDGKFFMRQSIAGPDGSETAVDERELTWVVGSAHHSRTYLVTIGDKLFQAPVCWYTQGALWDLCPGYESNNDYFSREISRTCVFCHNGRMTLRPGAHNAYDEPIPHGIDCERCHGPGEAHVARWARGESPTGEGDSSIVNPRRLTPELRMQICFQCHLGDSKSTERVARHETALEGWRPGQPITTAMLPYRFSEATPHEYGLSAQADRLLLSRCFLESGGKLECVTCHNPHITVYRADRPADFFTAKCLSCHGADACIAPPAARQATSPPDDCVACHMRRGEPDDHRHTQFTDHWIRRRIDEPPAPRTSVAIEPYLPKAVAALPEGERAYYAARAISLRAHSVPPPVQKRMWPDAAASFQRAIDAGFSDPQARFFLGKALAAQGKHRDAAAAYAAAYAADPRDHDIALAHGQALLRSGRPQEAERVFDRTASDHPEAAGPLAELARVKAGREDYAGAAELFGKAVALEPWTASMRVNLAMMLSALDRHAEAVAQAEQALRLDPAGAATWEAYATILTRADRATDAAQALKKAKALAYASRGRMNDVRAM